MLKDDVKKGDELIEHTDNYGSLKLVKVDHVTPTGQIVLEDGSRFYGDGREVGKRSHRFGVRSSLEPATPEMRREVIRQANVAFLKTVNWNKQVPEKLVQIVEILNKE
jgi:hypothetical protein